MWGLGGVGGAFFIAKFKKRLAHKLRRTILFHFGLVTCRFRFPQIKVLFFMMSGPSGRVTESQTPLFLTLEPPSYFKKSGKLPKHFSKTTWEIGMFNRFGKDMCQTNNGGPSYNFLKILNIGSICSKKHEMGSVGFFNSTVGA